MADTEEEQTTDGPKRDGGVGPLSAHNNPPNQTNKGEEVETGDAEKSQKED